MNDLTLIRKNLFRKKLRAILLTLSILIAFLIFGVLGAFYSVWTSGGAVAADNRLITVNRINFTVSMPYAYWTRVSALDGVDNVSQANWFGGYYQDPTQQVQTFAVDPETYLTAYPELTMPAEQRQAFLETRDCLLVGTDLAAMYGWSAARWSRCSRPMARRAGNSTSAPSSTPKTTRCRPITPCSTTTITTKHWPSTPTRSAG